MPRHRLCTTWLAALLLLLLLRPQTSHAQRPSGSTLAGCLNAASGNFTLGEVPSGYLYRLQGNTSGLAGYNNHLVRITGSESTPANSQQTGTFNVQKVQVIADSCTFALPPQNAQADRPVTGKVSERQDATNTSTTEAADENTPGSQTEAGAAQETGRHDTVAPGNQQNQPANRGPLAPPTWGQTGQAPQQGNTDAAAAGRAEEQPGHTLGVNAMPGYANPTEPVGAPDTQGSSGTIQSGSQASGSGAATPNPQPTQTGGQNDKAKATKRKKADRTQQSAPQK